MDNFLKHYPEPSRILEGGHTDRVYEVNGHIHTPYSFSAFTDVDTIFEMAVREDIKILGINDFYTTGGYREFYANAVKSKVFPLFNIEFIALDRELQKQGIRVNDPNNPGRTYFSGKGLDYPETLDPERKNTVEALIRESLLQVESMIGKTNGVLDRIHAGFNLDFQQIRQEYARELVRERHIAKALRIKIFDQFPSGPERLAFLTALYDGKVPVADQDSATAVENEIRNNLLKAGGKAFVEEDEKAFLSVDAVIDLIIHSGGIPCYPVLLDDARGNFTDFEGDRESLYHQLTAKNIFCIELIPGRNDAAILEEFVRFFHSRGFIILLGTEHNTPDMVPLTVSCRKQVPLTGDLKRISYEGACILAAHQYLRARGEESAVGRWNSIAPDDREMILSLGKAVINYFLHH
jgi:hypothetical protein